MNTTNYTAITIGPIYDTMILTSSPAGLWGASYVYSWIAKNLIIELVKQGDKDFEKQFISPFFCLVNGEISLSDENSDPKRVCDRMHGKGVGMFHDRIIFCSENVADPLSMVENARRIVIKKLAEKLGDNISQSTKVSREEWLKNFLRIYYINVDVPSDISPFIYLGRILAAAELEPHFLTEEEENLLLTVFENVPVNTMKELENRENANSGMKNQALKKSFLVQELTGNWILEKDTKSQKAAIKGTENRIRDLQDIASAGRAEITKKYSQYYVVLKSDGDSMGKIIEHLTSREELRDYSQKCLMFCAKAADQIIRYGGMPIYAGGDDLLALLPVVGYGANGEELTVLGLVECIRELFNENFKSEREKLQGSPTISFGLAAQYYKSPLYEALERAGNMLDKAKSCQKNACYFDLQKHSGQSLLFWEERMDLPSRNLFSRLEETALNCKSEKDEDGATLFLSNAGYQIEIHKELFRQAILRKEDREKMISNLFDNLFDNGDQRKFKDYLNQLQPLILQIFSKFDEGKKEEQEDNVNKCIQQVLAAIRLLHFLKERKGDD